MSFKSWLGPWWGLGVPDLGLASWTCFRYGQWSLIHPWSECWFFNIFLKVQITSCPLSPHMGLWRTLEVSDLGLSSWSWYGYSHWSLIHTWSKFRLYLDNFWLALQDAAGSWLGFGSWSWLGYGHWSLIHQWSEFWLSNFILKLQRTFMSFKSLFGVLEDTGGSWMSFCSLSLFESAW